MDYSAIRKEWNYAICDNLNGIMLSEVSQKKKNTVSSLLYVESTKQINKHAHRYREQSSFLPRTEGIGEMGWRESKGKEKNR